MARVKQITSKNELSDEHHGIFDSIASSRGRISGPFSVLLHSPEIAGRAAHLALCSNTENGPLILPLEEAIESNIP
jgi:hypothetical protein